MEKLRYNELICNIINELLFKTCFESYTIATYYIGIIYSTVTIDPSLCYN